VLPEEETPMLPGAPIAEHGFFVTHFLTVKEETKSAEFYVGILGGKVGGDEALHAGSGRLLHRGGTI
jgi:hypothetical protein